MAAALEAKAKELELQGERPYIIPAVAQTLLVL